MLSTATPAHETEVLVRSITEGPRVKRMAFDLNNALDFSGYLSFFLTATTILTNTITGVLGDMKKVSALVFVRHGERNDEYEFNSILRTEGDPRPHDIPLTEVGRKQAAMAGKRLAREALPFSVVYTSPMRRCLETAAEIALQLDLPVVIVVSLAKSCSYYCECLSAGKKPGYATPSEVVDIVRAVQPTTTVEAYWNDDGLDCVGTIQKLIMESFGESASKESVTLIVGHCESQRDLARKCGVPETIETPYCGTAVFEVEYDDTMNGAWKLVQAPDNDIERIVSSS